VRTRVGYTGGTKEDPTYYSLGDHTETVQLDYDPSRLTYEELVEVFFASHDASYRSYKVQYMSAIFFNDPEQERIAREVKARVEKRTGQTLYTKILPASTFYLAEDYHQKYGLQGNRELFGEFSLMYPDIWDMVDSTAATRVNAYLYGYGSADQLQTELDGLGLSADGKARLLKVAGKLKPAPCPVPAGS
jgi:peptide-methionine (S)-S-oxide reductase